MISGEVVDKFHSEPVPFAHIFIPGTSTGSITDLYGNFSLEIPDKYLNQELQVSCLGFKSISFVIEKSTQPILIQLEGDIIRLEEVVVTPETGEDLMKNAFAKIYDTTDLILRGYYRMVSKVDTALVRSIESILDVYDSTRYLPQRNEGYWKVERSMEVKYDSSFWNEFDRTKSIEF